MHLSRGLTVSIATAIFAATVALCILPGCTREVKNNQKTDGDIFRPEFEKEGFINDDIYRVVIVAPREVTSPDIASIRSNAKMRALSSLQKYLMSADRIVDPNTNTQLLSIIESSGSLREAQSGATRLVYFFDIQRTGLRAHINRLAKKRQ